MSAFKKECLWTLGLGMLIVGCARNQLASSSASGCAQAIEVANSTDHALETYWTAGQQGSPSIRMGRAERGRTTLRLPEAVISRLASPGDYFYFRRAAEDTARVDMKKVSYRIKCM